MKTKKIKLAVLGLICAGTLAACSNAESKDVITMKGDTITVEDIYENVKTDSTVQNKISTLIINRVANNAYGDKVSDKEVTKEFDKLKEQYGDSFESLLEGSGYTVDSYKQALKDSLAVQKMIEAHIKITDEDLKTVWADFHPEVEVQLIAVADEATAKDLQTKIKDGEDFGKLAEENSTDASASDKGKIKFDSTSTTVPEEVKAKAYELKDGTVSETITVTSYDQSYQEVKSFYIVKMVKNQEKGNDMKPFKKELKKIATDNKKADSQFQMEVIGEEMKKANVKVKDEDIKSIVNQFMPESSSTEESKATSSSKETKSTKESSTKESSTEESTEASK